MKTSDAGARSRTETQQGETQQTVPRMPHERDESADSQAQGGQASAQAIGRVAHADQARGLADTSRANETDAAYRRLREPAAEAPAPRAKSLKPGGRPASR